MRSSHYLELPPPQDRFIESIRDWLHVIMEHLKCNQLACRSVLRETAVVTTCSHVFCVPCANELFGNAQVCPACSASLTEPDDIVVSSLQPTNDYKTSVLSGLSPGIILQICERAMSFWEYQSRQESAFQQAVLKSVNDKSAQYQKQLESVVREANSELGLLNDKVKGLERDLELERRKNRDHQEQLRERDKEYSKLKNQYDQLKRKALLAPGALSAVMTDPNQSNGQQGTAQDELYSGRAGTAGLAGFGALSVSDVVNGMEAGGIQRTPLRSLSNSNSSWPMQQQQSMGNAIRLSTGAQHTSRFKPPAGHNQLGVTAGATRYRRSSEGNTSDSANEAEGAGEHQSHRLHLNPGQTSNRLQAPAVTRPAHKQNIPRGGASQVNPEQRRSGTFRPAGFPR